MTRGALRTSTFAPRARWIEARLGRTDRVQMGDTLIWGLDRLAYETTGHFRRCFPAHFAGVNCSDSC